MRNADSRWTRCKHSIEDWTARQEMKVDVNSSLSMLHLSLPLTLCVQTSDSPTILSYANLKLSVNGLKDKINDLNRKLGVVKRNEM